MAKKAARASPPILSTAMSARRDRRRERGLSVIEAIIIVSVSALMALLLLPLAPRAASRNTAMTEDAALRVESAAAEQEFRMLIRAGPAREGASSERAVSLAPVLDRAVACARAGAPAVRLRVDQQALVCESEGRTRALLRWRDGAGAFAYSADGSAWSRSPPENARFVRFEIRTAQKLPLTWVERAGGPA